MEVAKISVGDVPLAMNVCDQLLRELGGMGNWSLAHVVMNPFAWSLLHQHKTMDELYIITRGCGLLTCGEITYRVHAGHAVHIPAGTPHQLQNIGLSTLEHLVLASPPFDADDVEILSDGQPMITSPVRQFVMPPVEECFDGARLVGYRYADASVAFGWVNTDPDRQKDPHFHREREEWIYVVEGSGEVRLDNMTYGVTGGDLVKAKPRQAHAIRSTSEQDLIVVCLTTPPFDMDDVHYR